jgi:serine/threonine protein phosphatase 1
MRLLAIGDIHGCLRALDTLLARVAPGPDDRLITLGDYVDRGPDSRGVLDRLVELHAKNPAGLIALRGNHDDMFLKSRGQFELADWMLCGGRQTLASYGTGPASEVLETIPEAHWTFLDETCVDWHEEERHFFVHANVYPDLSLPEQPRYMLLWEKLTRPVRHESGKVMVCGHTVQPEGKPLNLGPTVCIDTGIYLPDGWLTCLDVLTGQYWQANQKGEHRTGELEEPDE